MGFSIEGFLEEKESLLWSNIPGDGTHGRKKRESEDCDSDLFGWEWEKLGEASSLICDMF